MAEDILRWDEHRVPPFAGKHLWCINLQCALTDEQVDATDRGEPIIVVSASEPMRVSHTYCAYCMQAPNSVASREECAGPTNG